MAEHGAANEGMTRRQLLKAAGAGAGAAIAVGALPGVAGAVPAAGGGRVVLGGGTGGGEPLRLARVWPATPAQWQALWGFDDTHRVFADGSIELLLWPGDLARLDGLGIRYRITVADLVARDAMLREADRAPVATDVPGVRSTYRRFDSDATHDALGEASHVADLRLLADTYPDMVKLFEMPEKTLEGRTVYGIEVCAEVARRDGRPVFYMDGLHHAREWPAGEFTIMFAFDLLEGYGTDARITALMDGVRTVLVPVVNPDGFVRSRHHATSYASAHTPVTTPLAVSEFEYHRKNMRRHTTRPEETGAGIDVNRNYGFQWGGVGSSGSTTSQTYRGASPFSEPEARNVRAILASIHAITLNSNHTHGRLLLRPPGAREFQFTPDEAILAELGEAQAAHNGYRNIPSYGLYDTTGTTMDFAYGAHGSLAYTYEHATSFHPTYGGYIPSAYTDGGVRESFLVLAEAAANPEYHSVLSGRVVDASGNPVAAEVRVAKTFDLPLWRTGDGSNPIGEASIPEAVDTAMDAGDDGTFAFHVNPSRRPYENPDTAVPYTVTITDASGRTSTRTLHIERGEAVDLGTVELR